MLHHVLLPQGFGLNLAFKEQGKLSDQFLTKSFISEEKNNPHKIILGRHSIDGSYTELDLKLGEINLNIKTAHVGKDLVILIDPGASPKNKAKLVLETMLLWNNKGSLSRNETMLKAVLPGKIVKIFTTEEEIIEDPYVPTKSPYLCFWLNRKIGISTGIKRSIYQIESIINLEKKKMQDHANFYGDLSEIYSAIESSLGWSLVFEPKFRRAISTSDRTNGERIEGRYLIDWNNFFLFYLSGIISQDLAYANMIELFLNNQEIEKSAIGNRPINNIMNIQIPKIPVGSVLVKEIYKMHPNRWFLETCFQGLLDWNRWWPRNRINNGLLSYSQSDIIKYKISSTDWNDNSLYLFPIYNDVNYDKETGNFAFQDVGLNSLYIADCIALLEIAKILNRKEEAMEIKSRIKYFKREMEGLWSKYYGAYLNYNTETDTLSNSIPMTVFLPLLAQLGDSQQKKSILNKFYNEKFNLKEEELWPALNFLTYFSFRKAGFLKEAKDLSIMSSHLLKSGLNKEEYMIVNSFNNSNTLDLNGLLSKKYSFEIALLGIVEFIERDLIPKPELLIK